MLDPTVCRTFFFFFFLANPEAYDVDYDELNAEEADEFEPASVAV